MVVPQNDVLDFICTLPMDLIASTRNCRRNPFCPNFMKTFHHPREDLPSENLFSTPRKQRSPAKLAPLESSKTADSQEDPQSYWEAWNSVKPKQDSVSKLIAPCTCSFCTSHFIIPVPIFSTSMNDTVDATYSLQNARVLYPQSRILGPHTPKPNNWPICPKIYTFLSW